MRLATFFLLVMFAPIACVVFQNGVGDIAVREYLYGAVVASQLLLGEDI